MPGSIFPDIFRPNIIPHFPDLSSPFVTTGKIFVMNGKKFFSVSFQKRITAAFRLFPCLPAGQSGKSRILLFFPE